MNDTKHSNPPDATHESEPDADEVPAAEAFARALQACPPGIAAALSSGLGSELGFALGLRAAASVTPAPALDESVHDAMIELALSSHDELAAKRTRAEIAQWSTELRAAHAASEPPDAIVNAAVEAALAHAVARPSADASANTQALAAKPLANQKATPNSDARPIVRGVAWWRQPAIAGAVAAFAAAAALFVWMRVQPNEPRPVPHAALIAEHSTANLFDAPFEGQGATARMDRIAAARRSDLRENRFRRWGLQ